MALKTHEIWQIMTQDQFAREVFAGVFPIDRIPSHFSFPAAIIINTDPHDKPGQHWISIYFESSSKATFFDSFGQPPEFYGVRFDRLKWSSKRLQSSNSVICGLYCCLFVMFMARNLTLNKFLKSFSSSFLVNDLILLYLFKNKWLN